MRYGMVAALSLAACASTKVTVNYDRSLDFGAFQTYSWARSPATAEAVAGHGRLEPARDTLVAKKITAAVDAELRKKGLTRVDAAGDLEARFQTNVSHGFDVVSYGYGPRWRGQGSTQVRAVGVGSVVVDMIDPRKKELAWRAVASEELDPRISAEDRESRFAAVAEKMFRTANLPARR